MASPALATRPLSHHGDGSQPQADATVRDSGRRPSPGRVGLGLPKGPDGGAGAASSPRGTHPRVPMPTPHSRTRFIHCRGQPARTHICSKRPKRPRIRRCLPADLLDNTDATRPPVPSPEGPPLEGDQQSPSTGQGPFFYIGGTNGASIVSAYCRSRGWQRTQDGRRADCKLKWCEVKCRDSYCSFREGQQLLFQLPNNKLLTTKIGLLTALSLGGQRCLQEGLHKQVPEGLGQQGQGLLSGGGLQALIFSPVHAEEKPLVRATEGGHGMEHGPPQQLHQRQVQEDQGPPPRLGLHHLHGPSAAVSTPAVGREGR
uniref:Uncharacterized protein n=1 Tax=Marmota marmota marmota TaxID=9994 RepID=A0A8C6A3S2_MARMA